MSAVGRGATAATAAPRVIRRGQLPRHVLALLLHPRSSSSNSSWCYPGAIPAAPRLPASRHQESATKERGEVVVCPQSTCHPHRQSRDRGCVWGRGSRAVAPERRSLPATPPAAPLPLPGGGAAGSGSRARRAGGGGAPLVARIRGWGERALRSKDLLWQAGARAAALEVLSHSRPGSGCLLHAPNRQHK